MDVNTPTNPMNIGGPGAGGIPLEQIREAVRIAEEMKIKNAELQVQRAELNTHRKSLISTVSEMMEMLKDEGNRLRQG